MARKNVVASYKMFDAVSLASTQTSQPTSVLQQDKATIHLHWTGTSPVGVVSVQARNGAQDSWYDLQFDNSIAISGNTGDHQIIFLEMPFTDIRLVYTRTSGVGALTATITLKQVGG